MRTRVQSGDWETSRKSSSAGSVIHRHRIHIVERKLSGPGCGGCRGSRPFDCPSHQSVSNCFFLRALIVMEVMVSWDRTDMWNTSSSAWNDSANGPVRVVGDVLPYDNPILALVLFSFCLATVFGNALVIAAVARERYLHTVTNYFITSLAVADCLVGSIVMPFSVAVEMQSDRRWLFGRDLWYIVLINKFLTWINNPIILYKYDVDSLFIAGFRDWFDRLKFTYFTIQRCLAFVWRAGQYSFHFEPLRHLHGSLLGK